MSRILQRTIVVTAVALLFASGVMWVARGRVAAAEPVAGGPVRTMRQGLELTVYSQDFGMVREQRPVQLVQGTTRLRLYEVSKQLDPQSLLLQWTGAGNN